MSTYSNNVPSGAAEVLRYNYYSNINGASLKASIKTQFQNDGGASTAQMWVTLNSGDTSGNNNSQGWRGDGKNADVLVEQVRVILPNGPSAVFVDAFFDGIYSGYGVLSVWWQADTSTQLGHRVTRVVTDITKARAMMFRNASTGEIADILRVATDLGLAINIVEQVANGEAPMGPSAITLPASLDPWAVYVVPGADLRAAIDEACAQIDNDTLRRQAADFTFDFGATVARADDGTEVPAGERALQCAPDNMADWQGLGALALSAIVAGQGATVMAIRVSDNANVQTPATQVQAVLAALGARQSALKIGYGAANKARVRAAASVEAVAAALAAATWPA